MTQLSHASPPIVANTDSAFSCWHDSLCMWQCTFLHVTWLMTQLSHASPPIVANTDTAFCWWHDSLCMWHSTFLHVTWLMTQLSNASPPIVSNADCAFCWWFHGAFSIMNLSSAVILHSEYSNGLILGSCTSQRFSFQGTSRQNQKKSTVSPLLHSVHEITTQLTCKKVYLEVRVAPK